MSNDEDVFEKQHSRLIFNSSLHEHLKEAIHTVEQENWLNLKRRWSSGGLWAWFFRWSNVSWKELLHPSEVKKIQDTKNKLFLHLLTPERRVSWTNNSLPQRIMHNGIFYDILIIPDLRPPAQRRMNAFRNNWQDFCCWVCLQGSRLAEWGPVPARVQQTWRGLKDLFEADCNMDSFLFLFLLRCFFISWSVGTQTWTTPRRQSHTLGAESSTVDTVPCVLEQCLGKTQKNGATKGHFLNLAFLLLHSLTLKRLVKAGCNLSRNQVLQQM